MLTVNFNEIDIYEVIKENYNDERIQAVLNSLPEIERTVLEMRIGINGEKMTRQAIANSMDSTIDRIRGFEERALKKLKHPARISYLNAVLDPNFEISDRAREYIGDNNKKMI